MQLLGTDLMDIGFAQSKALGIALQVAEKDFPDLNREATLALLKSVLDHPSKFLEDKRLSPLALQILQPAKTNISLSASARPYKIYGPEAIEEGALNQMETAMRLPVTVAGALMPDAHQGYGLPIGGVLATQNAVIPYGVGVDIGCRMCMTLYDIPANILTRKKDELKKVLVNNTRFGLATFKNPKDHEVLGRSEFSEIRIAREMKDRAWEQLGSSGGGNHFVEFGIVDIVQPISEHGLAPGQYVALLSHSGSRGLGANIARHYTRIAMDNCKLPGEARHLAWLGLDAEAGEEYWKAMNLAGDYASACHHQIHQRMASALGETPVAMIENHHNFAWKENDALGNEVIVHRKGATPAGKGVLGIIPGSMATPGFIVRGKGEISSINSASHGAGRTMSRTRAKETILPGHVNKVLKEAGVELIGAGLDEAPMAYKDIHQVMSYQKDLVDVMGSFMPRIVRMCGDDRFKEVD
jgi:tRNA-splicing ligase RtcB (3'-phosphate/5'-hydroxy nucleic acid ligase)